jgi:hypothetical protein
MISEIYDVCEDLAMAAGDFAKALQYKWLRIDSFQRDRLLGI